MGIKLLKFNVMKHAALTILTFALFLLISCKDEVVLDPNTYIVDKPGYLVLMINEVDRNIHTELKIKGNIDARDIRFLKNVKNLTVLDLSDAKIHSFTGTGGTYYGVGGNPQKYNEDEFPRSAFYGFKTIKIVTLPNSIDSIAETCFAECTQLESITIGNSVIKIGSGSFSYCKKLQKITFLGSTPPIVQNIGYQVDQNNCVLDIPKGSSVKYKSATYWKDFKNIIERDH